MRQASFPYARATLWLVVPAILTGAFVLTMDEPARSLAGNTLLLASAVASLSLLLGAPLGFLWARTDLPGGRFARVALAALLFMPLYLQAAGWEAGFGLQGWLTPALGFVLLDGWPGAIIVHTAAAIPWVVTIVAVALAYSEPELEEEASLDGTPWQVFLRVTVCRSGEALLAAGLWVALVTAGEMTVTDLFQVRTYAEQIYTEFALGDRLAGVSWRAAPNMIAIAAIVLAGLALVERLLPSDRHLSQRAARRWRFGAWRPLAIVAGGGTLAMLIGMPLLNLLIKAGMVVSRQGDTLTRGWSVRRFAEVVCTSPGRFLPEIGWSAATAAIAATVCIAVALPLAWRARRGGWHAAPAAIVVAVGLAVPGPLVGLGLVTAFNSSGTSWVLWLYDHSVVPLCLAQAIRALPLCTLVMWYALRSVPADMLHSATLEGASAGTQFFRIALPMRWQALAVAWLAALAIAWGELPASILVAPPGVVTLPVQVFGLIHYGVDDQVAGISLVIWIGGILLGGALAMLAPRAIADENT